MICDIHTNNAIPVIWTAVANAKIQQKEHSHLVIYLMSSMPDYRRDFHGHTDLLHYSVPMCNFVTGNRFVNPG